MNNKFAKWTFRIAGIYGILVLLPMYWSLQQFGIENPPEITHPEFFYGFVSVALSWQVAFLIISTDTFNYRLLMIPSMLEKFIFVFIVAYLYSTEGMNTPIILGATLDCILGICFAISFIKTKP